MDKSAIIISGLQIAASVGSIVLFLVGLYAAVQDFQYVNPADPADEDAHTKAAARKYLLMTILGMVAHAFAIFFRNLPELAQQGYGVGTILVGSAWESLTSSVLLLIGPFILKLWRKVARRKSTYK